MSDTGGFPLVGGNAQFPGKNNVTRDGSGSNSFGWDNLNTGALSFSAGYRSKSSGTISFSFGSETRASGLYSFAVNTSLATGAESFSCCSINTASGTGAFASGRLNTSSGNYSATFGQSNTASGFYAFASGIASQATENLSVTFGGYSQSSRYGEFSHGCLGIATLGAMQHGWLVFANQSTSATPINLYLDGTTATKNAVLGTGARWKCTAEIIATTTGAINKSASWEYKFQIDRPTNAASTIIRTTPLLALSDGSNAGAPPAGWAVAITADTTNGCPQIQVTGDADTINWTCCIHYIQSIRV